MQKITAYIKDFITRNTDLDLIVNPNDFPDTPYDFIFIPQQKLVIHCISIGIELGSTYFFQELSHIFTPKNLKVIHLWEDIWYSKQPIVESRLRALLGKSDTIPARLTKVSRIEKPVLDKFLEDNHLQGKTNAKLKYGLWLPKQYFRVLHDESFRLEISEKESLLVAVASFSNAKKIVRDGQVFRSYEMIRFANYKGLTVVGGLNKLLKKFIEENSPDDIMTYADADWSDGSNYEKLGFERITQTPPIAFWVDKETFTRKYIEDTIGKANVYNAGNWKFLMKLKNA